MRPILALLVPIAFLGGLYFYMEHRPRAAASLHDFAPTAAEGKFSLDVTLTFAAGPDEFALDASTAPSLLVQLRGQDVLRRMDAIAPGEPLHLDNLTDLRAGPNEFYVEATPADGTQLQARALRVRIFRDGNPLTEETLWSEPGEAVSGTIAVDIPNWAANEPAVDATP